MVQNNFKRTITLYVKHKTTEKHFTEHKILKSILGKHGTTENHLSLTEKHIMEHKILKSTLRKHGTN